VLLAHEVVRGSSQQTSSSLRRAHAALDAEKSTVTQTLEISKGISTSALPPPISSSKERIGPDIRARLPRAEWRDRFPETMDRGVWLDPVPLLCRKALKSYSARTPGFAS